MTPTELHTLEALRAEMVGESGGRDGWWLTDACLCRYLRARNWDVTKVGFVPYAAHRFSGYLSLSWSRQPTCLRYCCCRRNDSEESPFRCCESTSRDHPAQQDQSCNPPRVLDPGALAGGCG